LLEDLGWAETVDRETVALTVPADQLTGTLARLHKDAAGSLGTGRTMNQAPAEKSGLKVFCRLSPRQHPPRSVGVEMDHPLRRPRCSEVLSLASRDWEPSRPRARCSS
jgi:hypothetical protein